MRLRVFQANDGDCLLLTSGDGRHMLVDGGRSGSFTKHAADSISECGLLDVVCVSHIDADHITGVLKLLETEVDWRIHLHEKENPPEGRKPKRKPSAPRPPDISEIWHNGFSDQLEDEAGDVRTMISLAAAAQLANSNADDIPREHYFSDLVTGEKQAIELSYRIATDQLNIPLNKHFDGKLVRAGGTITNYDLGDTQITMIGPFASDLKKLQKQWRLWLADNEANVADLRREIDEDTERLGLNEGEIFLQKLRAISLANEEFGKREDVSTPNLASIMFLAEENGASMLFTGDGAGQDILKGLKRAGKLDKDGLLHVNILKIQHHGATANINLDFCRHVIADHYVFCGNGAHHNPELGVIELIADARFGTRSKRSPHPNARAPFTMHFNSSKKAANSKARKEHMGSVEARVKSLKTASGGKMQARFNNDDFFDINLQPG